jgi:hypothetical protein
MALHGQKRKKGLVQQKEWSGCEARDAAAGRHRRHRYCCHPLLVLVVLSAEKRV